MIRRLIVLLAATSGTMGLVLAGPASPAHAYQQAINVQVTSYGYNDNNDPLGNYGTAVIEYPQIHDIATEDLGTYDQPVTFASDASEFAPGTIIYVPHLEKYFIMEDGCD